MEADHDFQIGSNHVVCQDYAMSGVVNDKFAYAIVCDGCSASPDVDFGARALALGARETLRVAKSTPIPYEAFGAMAIGKASAMFPIFPLLHPQALDSTLMVTWVQGDRAYAFLYGDGLFFHKTADSMRVVHVKFLPNPDVPNSKPAASYLAYTLDHTRHEDYLKYSGPKQVLDTLIGPGGESGIPVTRSPFASVALETVVGPGDVVGVTSDGIESFKDGGGNYMDWRSVLPQFTAFKTFPGVFVRRRLQKFAQDCRSNSTTHFDDISLAAIHV